MHALRNHSLTITAHVKHITNHPKKNKYLNSISMITSVYILLQCVSIFLTPPRPEDT